MTLRDMARSHVLYLMAQGFESTPYTVDGCLAVDLEQTQLLVSFHPQGRLVRVSAVAVRDVPPLVAVLREVNAANDLSPVVKVLLRDRVVSVEATRSVEHLTVHELMQTCHDVAGIAEPLGQMLATVHGGVQVYLAPDEVDEDAV